MIGGCMAIVLPLTLKFNSVDSGSAIRQIFEMLVYLTDHQHVYICLSLVVSSQNKNKKRRNFLLSINNHV